MTRYFHKESYLLCTESINPYISMYSEWYNPSLHILIWNIPYRSVGVKTNVNPYNPKYIEWYSPCLDLEHTIQVWRGGCVNYIDNIKLVT